jgi:ABC-type glutathione transport system ATPase component
MATGSVVREVPDLSIGPGQTALLTSRDDRVLANLGLIASGQTEPTEHLALVGQSLGDRVFWCGKAKPDEADFAATLAFYRQVAYVGPESQLLANVTLLQTLCLELEYNQGAEAYQAKGLALECLESLGLSPLADLPPEKLVGPTRYVSLMALAVSRRPRLFVLEKPMALLRPLLFYRVLEALKDKAHSLGQATLILGHRDSDYRPEEFDLVLSMGDDPEADPGTGSDPVPVAGA